jgi:hypothetical protein
MPNNTPMTVDQRASSASRWHVTRWRRSFRGPQHIGMEDMTACELVALLTTIRPVFERRAAAQRQPVPVLTLLRPKSARRSAGGGER